MMEGKEKLTYMLCFQNETLVVFYATLFACTYACLLFKELHNNLFELKLYFLFPRTCSDICRSTFQYLFLHFVIRRIFYSRVKVWFKSWLVPAIFIRKRYSIEGIDLTIFNQSIMTNKWWAPSGKKRNWNH